MGEDSKKMYCPAKVLYEWSQQLRVANWPKYHMKWMRNEKNEEEYEPKVTVNVTTI